MPTLDELASGLKQLTQATEEKTDRLRGIVTGTKMFDPVIDNHRRMVFFETEQIVQLDATGKVYGKCCVFPGKLGVAQLFFYTTADDRARSRADFDSVLDSFAFEPGYGYESGSAGEAPTRGVDFSRVLMFGLIGGLLGPLCYRLLKSRYPNSPPRLLGLRAGFAMLILLGGLEFLIYPAKGPLGLMLVLGSIVVGFVGLVASRVIEVRKPHPPVEEGLPGAPPPA